VVPVERRRPPTELLPGLKAARKGREPVILNNQRSTNNRHPWAAVGVSPGFPPLSPIQKTKEDGIFVIINGFYFWNRSKAGMLVKTINLSRKAAMLLINKGLTLLIRDEISDMVLKI